jgi:hypothetical protein
MKKKEIANCEGDPYLTRWFIIRTRLIGIFLHRFHRSDEDRALHDHPWTFISIILWRGYWEHTEKVFPCSSCASTGRVFRDVAAGTSVSCCPVCEGTGIFHELPLRKRKWPGMILFRRAEHKHRVELVDKKEAWTLIIRFRRRREWGYHLETGWQHHAEWWKENCE